MLQPIASLARTMSKLGVVLLVLLTLAAGGVAPQQLAQARPALQAVAISFQKIADVTTVGGSQPVAIAHAGDGSGRLFIVEQPGRIMIYNGAQLLATPFLDIHTIVNSGDREQGLLGLAFDPQFATNGYFYVDYIDKSSTEGKTVVARYHVPSGTPNNADEGSALPLLTITQPQTNHNGGALQFGPDSFLYISTGDGGGGGDAGPGHNPTIGNAQDLNSLLGKILRIDVHNNNTGDGLAYDIPPGNPFASDGNPNTRAEIWAYGLRNPWRFSFDRQTGDMFIGDVGQGALEEIDFQPAGVAGRNYGWRCREGDQTYASDSHCASETFTEPILVYDHGGNKCAVMGGYRYRGGLYPQLQGVYFYADNCSGEIWQATGSGTNWTASDPIDTNYAISTFGEDEGGQLYFADRDGGEIYRIVANSKFVNLPFVRR
jgi:glucose/arabinose dehydrogenase